MLTAKVIRTTEDGCVVETQLSTTMDKAETFFQLLISCYRLSVNGSSQVQYIKDGDRTIHYDGRISGTNIFSFSYDDTGDVVWTGSWII